MPLESTKKRKSIEDNPLSDSNSFAMQSSTPCNRSKRSRTCLWTTTDSPYQVSTLNITDSITGEIYKVNADKYNRAKRATDTVLVTDDSGFNNLLYFLFSAMFSKEELKEGSINGTVKGTKALCPQRIHTIDEHIYNIYGQRYISYRQTKKFQNTINKKCSRLRSS
ncbi:unnamed protein product [Rotaria sp. Silwood2]|nr:unnamed protein product [Rotaria sp. Silwood2]CAF3022518.1 unnamed protein product [Rotaria sp. Silwood2]CAF3191509.1 unnamed protein product [Rotaria sp. Silwood2]CAF3482381.1 unnamed protein product [Rotaria sp. Silwood2]CAF4573001.1 unnamed protein product [Rotaria sp. Silwood2]